MCNTKIIIGPPGTGKTTTLLNIMEKEMASGVSPREIGFYTFTKDAAKEAVTRASKKFTNLDWRDFFQFSTIHAMAKRSLGIPRDAVMQDKNYKELGDMLGLEISGRGQILDNDEFTWIGNKKGDRMIIMHNLARARLMHLAGIWSEMNYDDITLEEFDLFDRTLRQYKGNRLMYDFPDMLELYIERGNPPRVHTLFIDEAQDLSKLQWKALVRLMEKAKVVYVAGDDDQAIFRWNGADPESFINLPGERTVLSQSYRLPGSVHALAQGLRKRIVGSIEKEYLPRPEEGRVEHHFSVEDVDMSEGNWLIMARNNYHLEELVNYCIDQGYPITSKKSMVREEALDAVVYWERLRKGQHITIPQLMIVYKFLSSGGGVKRGFKTTLEKKANGLILDMANIRQHLGLMTDAIWHEALDLLTDKEKSYFLRCLKRGEKLTNPRIRICTIHAAKGAEADNVLLLTDMANRTYEMREDNPSDEYRVFYVAVTRAKKVLHIIHPQTDKYFEPLIDEEL